MYRYVISARLFDILKLFPENSEDASKSVMQVSANLYSGLEKKKKKKVKIYFCSLKNQTVINSLMLY